MERFAVNMGNAIGLPLVRDLVPVVIVYEETRVTRCPHLIY